MKLLNDDRMMEWHQNDLNEDRMNWNDGVRTELWYSVGMS